MQADERHLVGKRQIFGIDAFAQARRIGRAAAQCEVLAADHYAAAVHGGKAEHILRVKSCGLSRRQVMSQNDYWFRQVAQLFPTFAKEFAEKSFLKIKDIESTL